MKALRIVLGTLLGLVVLYLVLCLAGPKKLDVVRTREIAAPASVIYGFIYDFHQWEKWSPWQLKDTTIVNTYSGKPYGLGSVHSWTSEKSGSGSQEIIEEDAPNFIKTKLQIDGWGGYSLTAMKLEAKEGCKTLVSWTMEGDKEVPFFMRAMMIFMGQAVGKDYSKGLKNLQAMSEEVVANLPNSYRGVTIEETELQARTYAGIRQRLDMAGMQSFFESGYGIIGKAIADANATPAGAPAGLYYEWDEATGKTDMAVAMPVNAASAIPGVTMKLHYGSSTQKSMFERENRRIDCRAMRYRRKVKLKSSSIFARNLVIIADAQLRGILVEKLVERAVRVDIRCIPIRCGQQLDGRRHRFVDAGQA